MCSGNYLVTSLNKFEGFPSTEQVRMNKANNPVQQIARGLRIALMAAVAGCACSGCSFCDGFPSGRYYDDSSAVCGFADYGDSYARDDRGREDRECRRPERPHRESAHRDRESTHRGHESGRQDHGSAHHSRESTHQDRGSTHQGHESGRQDRGSAHHGGGGGKGGRR